MIDLIEISPTNERPIAERLRRSITAAWPDIAASPVDRIRILVGIRTIREIDLLVTVDLAEPRALPSIPRRDGTRSPTGETIQAACLAIEVKQLDQSRFVLRGTEAFPIYDGKTSRSVNTQVDEIARAVVAHRERYGVERFFVHGIGWLTEVDDPRLDGINPWIVGSGAGWLEMLDAAAQQSHSLYGPKSPAYRSAIETIADTLSRERVISPRDRARVDALCRDEMTEHLIDDLAERVGRAQIRLTGRGGSGKTTALALLAKRLAETAGERVLLLTFHRTLRADIAHLIDTLVPEPTARTRIGVEAAFPFFCDALRDLEIALPMTADGKVAHDAIPALLARIAADMPGDGTGEAAEFLREIDPARFGWDVVLIDESQDWHDGERDFVRALYGAKNVVLADGLEQLVRRQSSCDWSRGLQKAERYDRHLGRSLRMTKNVAAFANAFARECGLVGWDIKPVEELAGGRVIVAIGAERNTAALARMLSRELAAANAAPVDALLCVPPALVETLPDGTRRSRIAEELRAAGASLWDASDDRVRDEPPTDAATWRVVQYDSSRGLEGWVSVAFGLDQLAATKRKHPNLGEGEAGSVEDVVRRWLMIALTRAVQMSIITIADPEAPIVATLRAAAARLPGGVVEWTTTGAWEVLAGV